MLGITAKMYLATLQRIRTKVSYPDLTLATDTITLKFSIEILWSYREEMLLS